MDVDWRNVSVTIGKKRILAPCSGTIRPGRMVALMGPSGSGKTTLLSCLRQDILHEGEVQFDGARFTPVLRQLIGFCEQDDIVLPPLSVRQTLMFLAELRFGIGAAEAEAKVSAVMELMRLTKIADSTVGEAGAAARISGGERKRLCIARELLGEPRMLMCDEPTSGLDSTMAEQVIMSMRSLCNGGGVSVLAAIHQPSTSIFGRFDDLVLLKEGEVLYYGPSDEAEKFFTCHTVPRLLAQSTAEYLMDLLVIEISAGDCDADSPESAKSLNDIKKGTTYCVGMTAEMTKTVAAEMRARASQMPALPRPSEKTSGRRYSAPFGRQVYLLTRRYLTLVVGDIFTWLNLVQNIGLLLTAALLWMRLGDSEQDVYPRIGVCLWTVGTWMFFPMFGGIGTFPAVRRILEKELKVGCYSLESFYIARTLMLLPLDFVWPIIWTTGMFWITNLNSDVGVWLLVLLLVMLSFTLFQGIGLLLSAADMPPGQTSTVSLILITYFFAWAGFFMDTSRVPFWIQWLTKPNAFAYAFELMVQVAIPDSAQFICDATSSNGIASNVNEGCELLADGEFVLSGAAARARFRVTTDPWICLVVMVVAMIVIRLLAYGLLRRTFRTAVDGRSKGSGSPAPVDTPVAVEGKQDDAVKLTVEPVGFTLGGAGGDQNDQAKIAEVDI